jgi:5'-nucleotidase (lipoprotein e(P4) family)
LSFAADVSLVPAMSQRLPTLLALAVTLAMPLPQFAVEPANLDTAKAAVYRYVNSGEYAKDLGQVTLKATKYLANRLNLPAKAGEKRAIVFDIDETTLTNLPHMMANDFGYIPAVWSRWIASSQAKAIVPVQVIYDMARRADVAIFFITARKEADRAATEKNLREVGYGTWTKIYYAPNDGAILMRHFKPGIRKQLVAEGYTIVLNLGDQESDLAGGYAEKTFKLPNPVYIVK